MPFDYKKEYKEFYLPPGKPALPVKRFGGRVLLPAISHKIKFFLFFFYIIHTLYGTRNYQPSS